MVGKILIPLVIIILMIWIILGVTGLWGLVGKKTIESKKLFLEEKDDENGNER